MTRTGNPTASPALRARWQALAPREQNLVLVAGSVVAFALLWWLALSPALATLRTAPARHAELDRQLQHMQALQAEAQQLQAAAPRGIAGGDPAAALRASVTQGLGASAQFNLVGDRATVTLKAAPADALAAWLAQARSNARATPVEARLVRSTSAAGTAAQSGTAPMPRWDGSLVLALPPARP